MGRRNEAWGHKGVLLLVHQPQWPSSVQFVCFSLAVRPSSHATHSEPSRLTNRFGSSPAHNKSHGERRTFVHNARGVSGARTATLDAGLLVVRRHLAWLALFARARVARPPLRSQRLFEVRCPASQERRLVADGPVDTRRRKCGRREAASRLRRPGMFARRYRTAPPRNPRSPAQHNAKVSNDYRVRSRTGSLRGRLCADKDAHLL